MFYPVYYNSQLFVILYFSQMVTLVIVLVLVDNN